MQLVIGISAAPYTDNGTETAWNFVSAALSQHHEIVQIFFTQQGVLNCSAAIQVAEDEIHWPNRWQQLHQEYGIPLFVCHPSALKHGINEQHLMPGFSWGGLTQFAHAILTADRHLMFGNS